MRRGKWSEGRRDLNLDSIEGVEGYRFAYPVATMSMDEYFRGDRIKLV